MKKTVYLENGESFPIEVPDNATQEEINKAAAQAIKDRQTNPAVTKTQQNPEYVNRQVLDQHFALGREHGTAKDAFTTGVQRGIPIVGDVLAETQGVLPGPVKPAVQRAYQAGKTSVNPTADVAGQMTGAVAPGIAGAVGLHQLTKLPRFKWLQSLSPMRGPHYQRIAKGAAIGSGLAGAEQAARGWLNANVLDYYRKKDGSIDYDAMKSDVGTAMATGAVSGSIAVPIATMLRKVKDGNIRAFVDFFRNERLLATQKIKANKEIIDAVHRRDAKTLESYKKDPYKLWNKIKDETTVSGEAIKLGGSVAGGASTGAAIGAFGGPIGSAAGAVKGGALAGIAYIAGKLGKVAYATLGPGEWKKILRDAELENSKLLRELDELDRGLASVPVLIGTAGAKLEDSRQSNQQQVKRWGGN